MVGAGRVFPSFLEMVIEKESTVRYVPIADERPARTIGYGRLTRSLFSRAHHAFLSHLRAPSPVRL